MISLADLDRMASSKPWGATIPTNGLIPPSCPLCGRRGHIEHAWANIRHRAVLNCVCLSCPRASAGAGAQCDYRWNEWNGEGGDIQRTLDDWIVGA